MTQPAVKKAATTKASAAKTKSAAKKPAAQRTPSAASTSRTSSATSVIKKSAKKKNKSTTAVASSTAGATRSRPTPSRTVAADPLVGGASTKASRKTSVTAKQEKHDKPKYLSDKKWLAARREELIAERKRYTHNAEALAAEAAALMADREPGDVQFDEESGEGDTLAVERDRDLALSAQAREKVDEIDAALDRLDRGTYGQCIVGGAGDYIPEERLEALPMAPKCIAHQTSMF